jgi:hypothetical protein
MLSSSAEHVLSDGATELTRFTTAAGYDKTPGTAPALHSLQLWRVRYPLSEIASGDCVFSEYQGFILLDWDPAVIPNTTADGTLYTLALSPKTGGSTQTFLFTGNTNFHGQAPTGPDYFPSLFSPELDAVREYCVTLSAIGDGDLARGQLRSESVCASVTEIVKAAPKSSGCALGGAPIAPMSIFLAAICLILIRRWAAQLHR